MTTAVILAQDNQKIWSPHISLTILKVRFLGHPVYTSIYTLLISGFENSQFDFRIEKSQF